MATFSISKTQAQDFASSCFAVIIGEIKDACAAEETDNSAVEKTEHKNVA